MNYEKDEIITLTDKREFQIINTVFIDNVEYLYLKNTLEDKYTIVKVIEDKIFNLTNHEISLVIENMFRPGWGY